MSKKRLSPENYIVPLNMNKLQGRMMKFPSSRKNKNRQILLVYGHHASLERMFGMAEDLSKYGDITIPDLPGFGGMESLYKIKEKPTIDNLADYLATFIKLRFKNRRVTIVGVSLGFAIVTRMLQKYPEIAEKTDLVISLVGFVHYEDFKFKRKTFLVFRYLSSVLSRKTTSWLVKTLVLRPSLIRLTYRTVADKHSKLKDADRAEQNNRIEFEINLWKINDVRAYMDTSVTMLTLNLCDKQVNLPVHHVMVENDRYFDNHIVEQHMGVIYNKVDIIKSKMDSHAPTVIADAESAAPFIPRKLRSLLAS